MVLEILIFLLTTLVVYIFYSYKQVHNYFIQRDVKFVPGVPIFGNIFNHTMGKKHFLDDMQAVYDAHPDEKYVGFAEFALPILLIRDPDMIKSITVKNFDHFTDHRQFITEDADPIFGSSLIFMKGERWHNMRTTLSPAFTASKMKFMMPFMIENTKNIIKYLEDNKSQNVDVDDFVRRYANDVIASAGFGLKINSLKERDNEFYEIGSTVFDFTLRQRLFLFLVAQFPKLAKKLGLYLFPARTYKFFTNIVSSTIEYRKKEKVQRPDMIQLLLDTPREWTPEELTGQVFILFTAGFETSASAIVMAIHELALNPNIQERLYQEVRSFKEKELTFDNISELKYLDCVMNETLRKWSPAIFMDRTCVKPYELPPSREGGRPCQLKPGDIVYNMVNCLHMDPKSFPEPHKFDPDRFLEENKHNIEPYTYAPFGGGPRICIGKRFAILEFKVLMYHLVLNFKFVKTKKTMDPITLNPQGFAIKALNGSWVKFDKRQ